VGFGPLWVMSVTVSAGSERETSLHQAAPARNDEAPGLAGGFVDDWCYSARIPVPVTFS
jgi:hypothetical protein